MSNNIYLTRHLPRVDAGLEITSLEMVRKWATIDKLDINNRENPYLSDNIGSNIATLTGNLSDKNIDVIISSPFLRCIQTALKIKESSPKITKIYIDYGLSELITDYDFSLSNDSFNIEAIYQHSLTKLSEQEKLFLEVLNRIPNTIQNENDNDYVSDYPYPRYYTRITDTVRRINDTNTDKNILLVSHAYSSNAYQKPDLAYSQVVEIVSRASGSGSGGGKESEDEDEDYKMKYLKYKMKYLELKKLKL